MSKDGPQTLLLLDVGRGNTARLLGDEAVVHVEGESRAAVHFRFTGFAVRSGTPIPKINELIVGRTESYGGPASPAWYVAETTAVALPEGVLKLTLPLMLVNGERVEIPTVRLTYMIYRNHAYLVILNC